MPPLQVPRCSLSSMAFLLAELVAYTTARCAGHEELVARLLNAGFEVGRRAAELINYRCVDILHNLFHASLALVLQPYMRLLCFCMQLHEG